MSNRKIEKVNKILSHELARIINKEMMGKASSFITVTDVITSPDLRRAKVWISFYGSDKSKNLAKLNKNRGKIQQILNSRLKMKFVPKILFIIDESQDKLERIERLLKKDKEK